MAVINLQKDTRWGDLGLGLGGVAGQLAGAIAQSKVDQGVADITADQSISPQQKLQVIQAKFGAAGVTSYTNKLKADLLAQNIAGAGAETENVQQQARGRNIANTTAEATSPYAVPLLQSQLAGNAARNALTAAETTTEAAKPALLGAQTATEATRAPLIQAQTGLTAEEATGKSKENALLQSQLDAANSLITGDQKGIVAQLAAQGITDPTQQAQAIAAFRTGGSKAYLTKINEIQQNQARVDAAKESANIQVNKPQQTPQPQIAQATTASELATSTSNFLDALERSGDASGTLTGAPLKAWLEKHGFGTGDPNTLAMYENQLQAISQKATSGGGFFAEGRVSLARDVTPGLARSPLANIIATNAVADQQLAGLQTAKDGLVGGQNIKPLDDAITKWQAVKARVGSLESYISAGGNSVVLYQGNQVDPKTLKPVVEGQKDYEVGNVCITGADLIAAARRTGRTPEQQLAEMRVRAANGQ